MARHTLLTTDLHAATRSMAFVFAYSGLRISSRKKPSIQAFVRLAQASGAISADGVGAVSKCAVCGDPVVVLPVATAGADGELGVR